MMDENKTSNKEEERFFKNFIKSIGTEISKIAFFIACFLGPFIACGEKAKKFRDGNSNEWELVILDSIPVDYFREFYRRLS